MHVNGTGKETKIGQNGKPIEGSRELTAAQETVVSNNKKVIRKAAKKIGQYYRYNNEY